jgi:hypothetical protein
MGLERPPVVRKASVPQPALQVGVQRAKRFDVTLHPGPYRGRSTERAAAGQAQLHSPAADRRLGNRALDLGQAFRRHITKKHQRQMPPVHRAEPRRIAVPLKRRDQPLPQLIPHLHRRIQRHKQPHPRTLSPPPQRTTTQTGSAASVNAPTAG